MRSPVWQLEGHNARLRLAQLTGAIDLARPAEGLVGLSLGADSLGGARLLGMEIPLFTPGDTESLIECYARGTDLVAAYGESQSRPVRVDAIWRAAAPAASSGPLAVIELVVSVRTSLWNSRPELSVQSALAATDVLRLADESTGRFETLGREGACVIEPDGGPGCLLFRLPGPALSYAEMVHPVDFLQDTLQLGAGSDPIVHLRHRLFSEPLERGVILRARVCGVFLGRHDDVRIAAECYGAFATAEPLLGS